MCLTPSTCHQKTRSRSSERLRAISDRLKETQAAAATPDKDANKGRLAEILRRPEYAPVAPESSAIDRLLSRFFRAPEIRVPHFSFQFSSVSVVSFVPISDLRLLFFRSSQS